MWLCATRHDYCSHVVNDVTVQARLAASAVGALVSGSLSHPFDTIKTCMQGDIERATYKSLTQTAATIFGQSGITGFYRGFGWRYTRQVGAIFLLDRFFSAVPPVVFPDRFRET